MGFTDWRSNKALLDRTVRRLTDLGFNITNDEDKPLHATRKLKREPPNDFTVILAFPENYPLSDIRAHIQSVELKDKFIRCPIKHLSPPIMPFLINRFFEDGILEVCIRGAWNRRDFTDPMQVYEDVDEWVRDYILGGEFPYDFDFPENTFFFPVESKIQLFVDPFFLNQPYMQIGSQSFGTFELALCGRPEVGVLSRLVDLGGATVSIATPYDFPNAEGFFSNLTGEKSPDAKVTGLWQFCDVPPSPFAIAQKLLKLPLQLKEHLWKELHRDKNSSMFLGSNILFGLFFFLFGRPTCIFMVVPVGDQALDMEAAIKGPRYLKPHILSATEIFARHGKAVSVAKLGEAQISLLGAGALGSQVGLLLGRMGFQSFVVIDKEALAAGNVMRHSAFLSDVGCGKAEVVARQIGAINPYVKAIPHTEDVTNASFDFSTMGNSLVVSTIANDRAEQHVNQKLCEMGLTAVYGRTTTTSYACRVIRVRPGTDACLKCLECYAQFKDHRYVQLEDEKILPEDLIFQGCTAPSFLGANIDIGTYAHLVARVAFWETGAGDQRFHPSLNGNHFILASRVVASEPKLIEPFSLREEFFFPLRGCPHCGTNGLPYRCVVVAKEALDKMRALSKDSNGPETGGVLIGTVATLEDNERALVIAHATKPGPRAVHKRTYFDRDKAYCGDLVRQYHSAASGDLNYVGEWHSHPSKDTRPSPLDNASLYEVVRDQGYKISSPASIIQSAVDPTNVRATIYSTNGTQYDEHLIVAPFAELKKLFPKFVEDLDPHPVVVPKEDSSWQRKKRSLLSTLKQLWI